MRTLDLFVTHTTVRFFAQFHPPDPLANHVKGGFYDFTSDLSSKDTAYTSESLEPHTDTTYFTDPIVSFQTMVPPITLTARTLTKPNLGITSTPSPVAH